VLYVRIWENLTAERRRAGQGWRRRLEVVPEVRDRVMGGEIVLYVSILEILTVERRCDGRGWRHRVKLVPEVRDRVLGGEILLYLSILEILTLERRRIAHVCLGRHKRLLEGAIAEIEALQIRSRSPRGHELLAMAICEVGEAGAGALAEAAEVVYSVAELVNLAEIAVLEHRSRCPRGHELLARPICYVREVGTVARKVHTSPERSPVVTQT